MEISADTVTVIVTILLAAWVSHSKLSERLSRLEGMIQGWLNPLPPSDTRKKGADDG